MPDVIACPGCQRKLRLDAGVIGRTVQCPSCRHIFTAEAPRPATPSFRLEAVETPPIYWANESELPLQANKASQHEEMLANLPVSYAGEECFERHQRGTMIKVCGILSLVTCCIPLFGLLLAVTTVVLASNDLRAMQEGRLDRSGETATLVGRKCALIASLLGLLSCFCWMGGFRA